MRRRPRSDPCSSTFTSGGASSGEFVLVLDLAEDFLNDVLDRDDAAGAPYSSVTMAIWTFCLISSSSSSRTGLVTGTKTAGRSTERSLNGLPALLDAVPGEPAYQVFHVEDPDDVVERALVDGDAR